MTSQFTFTGKRITSGHKTDGTIEAETQDEAIEKLRGRGIAVNTIEPLDRKPKPRPAGWPVGTLVRLDERTLSRLYWIIFGAVIMAVIVGGIVVAFIGAVLGAMFS